MCAGYRQIGRIDKMEIANDETIENLQDALITANMIIEELRASFRCDPITFKFAGIELNEDEETFSIAIEVKVA